MKTILYNRTEKKTISPIYPNGYNFEYPFGELPADVIEIEVVENPAPKIDPITQYLTFEYEVQKNKYVQIWKVEQKDEQVLKEYFERQATEAIQNRKALINQIFMPDMDYKSGDKVVFTGDNKLYIVTINHKSSIKELPHKSNKFAEYENT